MHFKGRNPVKNPNMLGASQNIGKKIGEKVNGIKRKLLLFLFRKSGSKGWGRALKLNI